jgi:hypothetical protein
VWSEHLQIRQLTRLGKSFMTPFLIVYIMEMNMTSNSSYFFQSRILALDQSKQHRTRDFWRLQKSELREIFWVVPIDIDENTDMLIWLGYRDDYSY